MSPCRPNRPVWGLASATSRVLAAAAIVTLLFAAHQYWGTDVRTAWEQRQLRTELSAGANGEGRGDRPDAAPAAPGPDTAGVPLPPVLSAGLGRRPAGTGAPLGTLTIERIGLDAVVVDGVSREDLQRGPGRIPGTAVPGEGANSVVAGHRTTWGAPFARLDEMRLGDRVVWTTTSGSITYEVVAAASGAPVAVVSPTDRAVTEQRPGLDAVTLVTCHPRFSAAERLVVVAHRVDPPIGADPPPVASVPAAPVAGALTRPAPDVPWTALVPPGVLVVALWVLGEVMAARPGRGGRARLPRRVAWRAATWAAALVPLLVTFDRLADLVPEGV